MATKHSLGLAPHRVGENPEYGKPQEGSDETDGYVGVAPEYRNAANKSDEPHEASGDKLEELADAGVNNQFEFAGAKDSKDDDNDEDEDQDEKSERRVPAKKAVRVPPKANES